MYRQTKLPGINFDFCSGVIGILKCNLTSPLRRKGVRSVCFEYLDGKFNPHIYRNRPTIRSSMHDGYDFQEKCISLRHMLLDFSATNTFDPTIYSSERLKHRAIYDFDIKRHIENTHTSELICYAANGESYKLIQLGITPIVEYEDRTAVLNCKEFVPDVKVIDNSLFKASNFDFGKRIFSEYGEVDYILEYNGARIITTPYTMYSNVNLCPVTNLAIGYDRISQLEDIRCDCVFVEINDSLGLDLLLRTDNMFKELKKELLNRANVLYEVKV